MGPKIKLIVEHGKHSKPGQEVQSGAKLGDGSSKNQPVLNSSQSALPSTLPASSQADPKIKTKAGQPSLGVEQKQSLSPIASRERDASLSTIQRIKSHEADAKKSLGKLIESYKQAAEKELTSKGYDPEKQAKISQHLKQLRKEHRARLKKIQSLNKSAQMK